jgi:hypothetical protein
MMVCLARSQPVRVRDELFEGWSLYGRPPSALVASLRGWGQLQRSCLRAPL